MNITKESLTEVLTHMGQALKEPPAEPKADNKHTMTEFGGYAESIITNPADYDGLEIHGVRNIFDELSQSERGAVSQYEVDNDNPEFYSVYAHLGPQHSGGVECIGDFATRAEAQRYAEEIAAKYGWRTADCTNPKVLCFTYPAVQAAPAMVLTPADAIRLALRALNTAVRFTHLNNDGHRTDSYVTAAKLEATLKSMEIQQPEPPRRVIVHLQDGGVGTVMADGPTLVGFVDDDAVDGDDDDFPEMQIETAEIMVPSITAAWLKHEMDEQLPAPRHEGEQ